jgi:hypothetical protein
MQVQPAEALAHHAPASPRSRVFVLRSRASAMAWCCIACADRADWPAGSELISVTTRLRHRG